MPIVNRIAEFADDMTAWRRHLHQIPELRFDCPKTAAFIADRLRDMGVDEIHEGIATTGIVAIINGQAGGPTVALRADFDALPLQEATGVDYASTHPGAMHACGHDGHTTMLLGAARYLAETRNFKGRVALMFQPAEEDGGGAKVMLDEGILDRFNITQAYALHTDPGAPAGTFATTPGPIMAGVDSFRVMVRGAGGHGAYPHETKDPVVALLAAAQAFQTIKSRSVDPVADLALSITEIHGGTAENIVPEDIWFGGTIRTFSQDVRQVVLDRLAAICTGISAAYDVQADLIHTPSYPPTINHTTQTDFAANVASDVVGAANVRTDRTQEMGAEDFAYVLEKVPGSYLFIGQGEGPALHNPGFNFNDDIAPIGASFFARLVERALPTEG